MRFFERVAELVHEPEERIDAGQKARRVRVVEAVYTAAGCRPRLTPVAHWDWQALQQRSSEAFGVLEQAVGHAWMWEPLMDGRGEPEGMTEQEWRGQRDAVLDNLAGSWHCDAAEHLSEIRPWCNPALTRTARIPGVVLGAAAAVILAEPDSVASEQLRSIGVAPEMDVYEILAVLDRAVDRRTIDPAATTALMAQLHEEYWVRLEGASGGLFGLVLMAIADAYPVVGRDLSAALAEVHPATRMLDTQRRADLTST